MIKIKPPIKNLSKVSCIGLKVLEINFNIISIELNKIVVIAIYK